MVRLIGSLVIATSLLLGLTVLLTPSAQAQTYTVLYDFTGGVDGGNPYAGLTADGAGKFYGTSFYGGAGYGAVLELRRAGTGWLITPLYNFKGGEGDGAGPYATLTIGPDGTLYGTTGSGGGSGCSIFGYSGCGTVFSLRPPPTACKTALCGWTETVLHRFQTHSEGEAPFGAVIFDQAGNLYGTTNGGGLNYGVVYELTPSGQGWNESVLYKFTGQSDGNQPWAGLVFDKAGNLYGTTVYGGDLSCYSGTGCGTVFRLTPSPSGWTENTLYRFHYGGDGEEPFGGLIFDSVGNLYGGNLLGSGGGGTIFRLSSTGGVWTLTTIYSIA